MNNETMNRFAYVPIFVAPSANRTILSKKIKPFLVCMFYSVLLRPFFFKWQSFLSCQPDLCIKMTCAPSLINFLTLFLRCG